VASGLRRRADGSPKWRTDYTAELSPGPLDIGFDYHFGVPSNHGDLTGVYVENRFVYGLRSGKIPAGMKLPGPDRRSELPATYTGEDMENARAKILDLDAPRRKNERVMATLTDKATGGSSSSPPTAVLPLLHARRRAQPVTPDKDLAGKSAAGPTATGFTNSTAASAACSRRSTQGLAENTLVIFTSDNGGVFKPENETASRRRPKAGLRSTALRGGKHDVWEGGFKVPFLVRWPGKVPPAPPAAR
jgi:arylsulfatase A